MTGPGSAGRRPAAALALLVLALLVSAQARQPGKVYRIGAFHVGDHVPPALPALRSGLAAQGYEVGKSLQLDFQNVADEEGASRAARRFVQARVDLIVAFGDPAVRAARAVTAEIPILMIHVTDPVAQGFAKTLARPGLNLTGFVFFAVSPAKHVELFKAMVPRLQRLLVLVDPGDPATPGQLAEMRKAAEILKLRLTEREATDRTELERIFGTIAPGDVDGVVAASNTLHIKFTALLIRLTSDRRLPLASYRRDAVEQGALFSYAPDDAAVGRQAATVADKILKGARPSDLPVEEPRKLDLVVNLGKARALGLAIPPEVLLRADHIVR